MSIIHLDFETRSKVDIRKCGAGRYASDPSTKILCSCWAVDNGKTYGIWGEQIPDIFFEAVEKGWKFSAFNAIFEQLIWSYRWPNLPVPEFICTRTLAASHGLPQSLNRVCKALHIGFTKDKEGARLINKYSKPNKEGGFNTPTTVDRNSFLRYCAKDVVLSKRIMQRLPALTPYEQEVYNWTVKTNLRGLSIDTVLADKAEQIATQLMKKGNAELARLTNNKIMAITQIQRIKNYIAKEFNVETDSLDKEAITELLTFSIPERAKQILRLRRSLSQTSVKKYQRAKESVCPDGKVRDTLIYHGASTGRWTSQVVQFQNLPRYVTDDPETALKLAMTGDVNVFDMCYDNPMQVLTGCIRGLVVPQEGKKLAVVDYNAIEARVLMWRAGQHDAVDIFRRGDDIYVEMARAIYNNEGLTKKDKKERFLGKTTTLGCGYQMGVPKFQGTCDDYGVDLGEKTEHITRENKEGEKVTTYYSPLAKRAVETYRSRFSKIPDFWYGMQQAALLCVKTGKAFEFMGIVFSREREYLYMKLPSGRRLAYLRPGVDKDGLFYFGQASDGPNFIRKRTYGGKLTENCIQAIARDILAHGILLLEQQGWEVLMTVHDENIVSMKQGTKAELDDIIDVMCTLPDWAKGCPITAEGFITDRYRKG